MSSIMSHRLFYSSRDDVSQNEPLDKVTKCSKKFFCWLESIKNLFSGKTVYIWQIDDYIWTGDLSKS